MKPRQCTGYYPAVASQSTAMLQVYFVEEHYIIPWVSSNHWVQVSRFAAGGPSGVWLAGPGVCTGNNTGGLQRLQGV